MVTYLFTTKVVTFIKVSFQNICEDKMSKTPQLVEKLKLIGFTDYTSRAYLALVKLGEATAPDIARESNIPQSKIYGVLDDLYDKGFVGKAGEGDKRKDQSKKKTTSPTIYFAYKPQEKIASWLNQFKELATSLEKMYDSSGPSYEYGYYSIGNYTIKKDTEKYDAGEFVYIFEQIGDIDTKLYTRFFTGRIVNHYTIGGEESIVLGITNRNTILLMEKDNRVQLLSIEEPIFAKIVDVLFALAPVNRSITGEMSEISRDEKILYIDSVASASGFTFGNDGLLWITEERIFIQMPGKTVYARPIFSIDSCYTTGTGSFEITVKSKDGIEEVSEVYPISEPTIVVNVIDFIKRCHKAMR